jgi:ParB-like chromosome segregation protein Spo0J
LKWSNEMDFHEAANIFPIDDEHIDALADDIKNNGQAVAIELMDGKVLDGRRRWLACIKADTKPVTREVSVDDPVAHVLSLNLHRRHLTPSQASMVGARAREIYDRQAKEKMSAGGGDKKSKSAKSGMENFPPPIAEKITARDAVGKAIGVSGKTIDFATRVLEKGTPELVKAVDEGRVAVSTAAILATESPERQIEEINSPNRKRKYTPGPAKEVVEKRDEKPCDTEAPGTLLGVGVFRGNEAVDVLKRIPKYDPLRKRGFQIVMDWIAANK